MTQDYEINVDPDMANNDTITIFINYRVFDYSGNFIGAIGVGLKAAAVKELIESYQQRYRRNIYFVNRDARIVLYGSGIDITQPDLYRRTGISDIAGDIIQEKHDALEYVKNGGTVLLSVRFVPELDWFLLVEQDESEALSALRRTLLINLLICALVTLTVLALVRYIVNYFQHRIEVLALSDKLTGLPNRQAFDLNFQQTMRQIRRHPVPVSIILFDIDRFKSVNDRFGHLFGDRVLRAVARTVADQIREVDLLCRWGGEEFLLLLPGCILRDAQDIAENIRGSIEHLRIEDDHHVTDVTVSLGVTEYRLGENEDDLLRRADDALYRAKEGGRNRCVVES
jgi:diguanylate cyclase (GGDEF)-like protein